jgi:hypothetical protein
LKYFFKIYFVLFLIFSSTSLYSFNDSNHKIPNELNIFLSSKSLKFYLNNITGAKESSSKNINDIYKKSFKISGSYVNEFGEKINISGKARLTGDWKDHIDIEKRISSLSIKLKNTNIGGVTNFRLLLPRTRNKDSEIFWSLLMSEIGFPVPYRSYITVNFNGSINNFIFEEKPEKEFLESIGIRESPIIESDERQIWANRIFSMDELKKISDIHSHQFKVKNIDFVKNETSELISLISISNLKPKNELIRFYNSINKKYAGHGLIRHNRKFVYDPIYNDYLPIYFDGMVFHRNLPKIKKDCGRFNEKQVSPSTLLKILILESKFSNRYLNRPMPDYMKCVAKEVFELSDSKLIKINKVNPFNYEYQILLDPLNILSEKRLNGFFDKVTIDFFNKKIIKMSYDEPKKSWLKKDEISYHKLNKFLSGDDLPKVISGYKIFNMVDFNFKLPKLESFDEINLENEFKVIDVKPNETKFLKISSINSKIKVNLNNSLSKIVFYNSSFVKSNLSIQIIDISNKNTSPIKYDPRLLTGCVSIIDSYLSNVIINSSNCFVEDNLNFIRTKGKNISINIDKALFDAFDSDFSEIDFDYIKIGKAGNDCIDVSSGIYNFNNIEVNNCGDKGISIGEKSKVAINGAYIYNSKLGIAVKDYSYLHIDKLLNTNVEECISAYQKKQEFGYGIVYMNPNIQNCSVNLSSFSKLNMQKACKYIANNYFYETCIQDNLLKIVLNKKMVRNSYFFFNDIKNYEKFNKQYQSCNDVFPCKIELKIISNSIRFGLGYPGYGNYIDSGNIYLN